METGVTKQQIISELTRSPHGDLKQYAPMGTKAAAQEPEFLAHLIAWNEKNGQIRDSKVALPVVSLIPRFPLAENSLAHLALLDPRNLVRALKFAKDVKAFGMGHALRKLVERYLRAREANPQWWERTALQHRQSMKTLYALYHIKPSAHADGVLFKGHKVGIFADVARLKDMSAQEAAGTILTKRIPFLVALGALGVKAKEPDLVLALIEQMSPTELVSNTKMLERLGIKTNPALRGAYDVALAKAADSKKVSSLKTTKAVAAVQDEGLKEKLRAAQEKQIQKLAVDGNWLVLGDKSGSMSAAIDMARMVAATLAKMVNGEVHLIFFDTTPRYLNASGKDYDKLLAETKLITANGGTSIGCGLRYALDKGLEVDGIAIISDGAENSAPMFAATHKQYCERFAKDVPVYLYQCRCEQPNNWNNNPDALRLNMEYAGIDLQMFDLRQGTDYYALPNLVQTMRASRYSLIDAIMETPLLTLGEVFKEAA